MTSKIILKKSSETGKVPSSLDFGELALNYADGKLFYKNASNSIVDLSGNPYLAGTDLNLQNFTFSHVESGVTAGTYNNVTVNSRGHVTAGSNTSYLTSETDTLATVTGRGNTTTTNIGALGGTALDLSSAGNIGTWIGGIQDSSTGWSLGAATIGFKSDNNTYSAIGIGPNNGLLYFGRTAAGGAGTMSSWLEVDSGGTANFKTARPQHNGTALATVPEITEYALPLTGGTLTGSRTISFNTYGGDIKIKGDSGGWATGLYFVGSSGTYRGGYGALGGGDSLSNFWIGPSYDNPFITISGSAVDSKVGLQQNGNQVLHAGNYTGYSGILRAVGYAGSTGIDWDTLGNNSNTIYQINQETFNLGSGSGNSNFPTTASYSYGTLVNFSSGATASAQAQMYISHAGNDLIFRGGWYGTSWQSWNKVLTNNNYNSYSPTLTGVGASGTWGINITGSAATATDSTKLPLTGGTISGRLSVSSEQVLGNERRYYVGFATASGVTPQRFEIARVYIDYNDWHGAGTILVELQNKYFYGGDLQVYSISYDYNNVNCDLIQSIGPRGRGGRVVCGNPTQISGDYYYIPVYVDAKYYNTYDIYITTSWPEVTTHGAHSGTILVYKDPVGTTTDDFDTVEAVVMRANSLTLSGNQVLHSNNYNNYSPTLTGTGASGTWGINVTGSAGSISGFNNPATAPTANTIVYRDGAGDIAAREIILSSGISSSTPTVLVSMFPTTNQLVRTTPGAVAAAIQSAASGTWGINVTGSAGSASYSQILDTRAGQYTPNDYEDYRTTYEFTDKITGLADWHTALTMKGWHDNYAAWQIIGPSSSSGAHENWYLRSGVNTGWNTLRTILHSGNIGNYVGNGELSVTAGGGLTGGGQLGTVNQFNNSAVTISHADTSSQSSVDNSNGTVIQDIALDTYGHITGISSVDLDSRYYTETEVNNLHWLHSGRDFINGTLITTSIDYSVSSGDPFILEIRGNSYGSQPPFDIQIQGYIYYDSIINTGGYSTGPNLTITAMNVGGKLCFWFARQSYWQGFNVYAYSAYAGRAVNKVESITDVVNPEGTKQVVITPVQVLRSDNFTNYAIPLSGGTITGSLQATGNLIARDILRVQNGTADWDSIDLDANGATHIINSRGAETGLSFQFDGTERMFLSNAGSLSINSNTALHAGNYTTYSWERSGGWKPSSLSSTTRQVGIASPDGGEFALSYTGGQTYAYVDGWFYQNEGQFRVLDTQNYSDYAVPQTDVSVSGGASKILKTETNGYLYLYNWINTGSSGLFSSTNSAHFYPNDGTYGSWKISGERNGWNGLEFASGVSLMANSSEVGFHRNGYGWQMWWSGGTGYVNKSSPGGGTQATILDSANYNSYSPTLTGGGASGTWGINISGNAATITSQANSATITASSSVDANNIVRRDSNGYIYANHINFNTALENPTISTFITENGDGWSRKSSLDHVKNSIRGIADGTWGINISGNAATATAATTADQIDGVAFRNTGSNASTAADSLDSNGITYVASNISLFGQSDGALYSQAYSSSWQHQIYGDYRTGQIAVRGKNSGSWQAWRPIIDTTNYNSYSPTLTGGGASGTWGINISGNAATATNSSNTWQVGTDTTSKSNALQYWQLSGNNTLNPDTSWWYALRMSHGDADTYYNATLAVDFFSDTIRLRRKVGGTNQSWRTLITDQNISNYTNFIENYDPGQDDFNNWYLSGFVSLSSGSLNAPSTNAHSLFSSAAGGTNSQIAVSEGNQVYSRSSNNFGLTWTGWSQLVNTAPGTSGNVLTSNGTSWISAAPSGGVGGLPTGGTVNQTLRKTSSTNYDAAWTNYGNEVFLTISSSVGIIALDTSAATVFSLTLTENTAFSFSSPPPSNTAYAFTLKVVQSSTPRTITWPNSVRWAGGTIPTLSTGSGNVDIFVFFTHDNGTNWYGFVGGQDLS